MTIDTDSVASTTAPRRTVRLGAVLVGAVVLAAIVVQLRIVDGLTGPAIASASTIFVSIIVQALPFLMLGVLLSGAIVAFVPPRLWERILPSNAALAVPVAGAAGLALPGCECASVPVSSALMRSGVRSSAALTFLLAAPAINPVVIVSTLVAFPGQPQFALARFIASFTVAVTMGWLWLKVGRPEWLRLAPDRHAHDASGWQVFRRSATHDLLHAGGFLVAGAGVAAILDALVPPSAMDSVAEQAVIGVLALAVLAVVLCVCSEADAFIAASFTQFSPAAQLAFMVVGPTVDLKLIGMQAGMFGRSFAARFAPATFAVAVLVSAIVAGWLLS